MLLERETEESKNEMVRGIGKKKMRKNLTPFKKTKIKFSGLIAYLPQKSRRVFKCICWVSLSLLVETKQVREVLKNNEIRKN